MKKHWVMDYETMKNFFCGVFTHYKTDETKIFVIHELQNDYDDFIKFLRKNKKDKEWHISFNGLAFDAQITHYILKEHKTLKTLGPTAVANMLYNEAQAVIDRSSNREFQKFPEWQMKIGQIDLFKLNHWDNMAKLSSLKWIEYTMDWENILDMPLAHNKDIHSQEDVDTIVEYCINDVKATKAIYNRSTDLIALRKTLSNTYDINLYNASEPRISKELFSYYLSRDLNIDKKELKKLRTFRKVINIDKIILPYIKFKTIEFNNLLERFKTVSLDPQNIKGAFKHSVMYKGVKTDFGLGGAHGANKAGIYEKTEDTIIMSSDVTSFYPNLAIRNGWSPAHLNSKSFCTLYEWFFEERKKIPKSNPMNYVYKIILNSTYGLSNDKNSFLYDPEFTMRITINGQLSLMMLYEMIMEAIPEAVAIMQNTDGVETIIPKDKKELYLSICKEWEKITDLNLEHDTYQKLVFADVNNYIGVFEHVDTDPATWKKMKIKNPHYSYRIKNGVCQYAPVKCKGRFEFTNLALHKNKSKLVIPKGIFEYFVNDTLPSEYLKSNTNILDYCIGSKTNGAWQVVADSIEDGELKQKNLQKINRYFITSSGVKLIKRNKSDGREIQLESGRWMQTVYNKMELKEAWNDYNVNEKYYLQAIEKEINNILGFSRNQMSLF